MKFKADIPFSMSLLSEGPEYEILKLENIRLLSLGLSNGPQIHITALISWYLISTTSPLW